MKKKNKNRNWKMKKLRVYLRQANKRSTPFHHADRWWLSTLWNWNVELGSFFLMDFLFPPSFLQALLTKHFNFQHCNKFIKLLLFPREINLYLFWIPCQRLPAHRHRLTDVYSKKKFRFTEIEFTYSLLFLFESRTSSRNFLIGITMNYTEKLSIQPTIR